MIAGQLGSREHGSLMLLEDGMRAAAIDTVPSPARPRGPQGPPLTALQGHMRPIISRPLMVWL